MNKNRKLDLALEAKEFVENGENAAPLPGVRAECSTLFGLPLTRVEVLNRQGEEALGKPKGSYLTLELPHLPGDRDDVLRAARAVSVLLRGLPVLPQKGLVLVAGLGNRRVTPDAIGPKTAEALLVTRHLSGLPQKPFRGLRPVAALATGVMGNTGMESGEILKALVERLRPVCLIAVDALAARRQERVCRTIQVTDTGIIPGSGVGNARMALNRQSLGIPVIALGVPTVVDAGTLCLDLLEERLGEQAPSFDPALFRNEGEEWFVTPRNVDSQVETLSRVLGLGISSALHVDFSVEDVEKWLS